MSLCQEVASLSVPSGHQVQGWLKEMAGPGEKLVISLGGGAWEGRTAMAAGLSGRINDKFSLRGSASLGNGNAGVSAAVGWRLK